MVNTMNFWLFLSYIYKILRRNDFLKLISILYPKIGKKIKRAQKHMS